jgi:2-phosphosulfolactate phosphatase
MDIFRVNRTNASQARGVVIVIDVIRAFSVAGYACAGGASRLWLVRTTEDALALRTREPAALLGGEIGGRLIPGFDFNNSPAQMAQRDVRGKLLIQRTGAGTQGAVAVSQASTILLSALTNAQATATYARALAHTLGACITLHPTNSIAHAGYWTEDDICADYIEALLRERDDAQNILTKGLQHLDAIQRFAQWQKGEEDDFPPADIAAVLAINRFNFTMVGSHKEWHGISYVDTERVDVAAQYG